jgi:hypothetical protein
MVFRANVRFREVHSITVRTGKIVGVGVGVAVIIIVAVVIIINFS